MRPLADPQRLLEQRVEGRADVRRDVWRARRARAHLAEDLGLADGHRVQPAGDREDVRDGAVLVVDVEVLAQLVAADRR